MPRKTKFTLNVNAVQAIISTYAGSLGSDKIADISLDSSLELPQTVLSLDEHIKTSSKDKKPHYFLDTYKSRIKMWASQPDGDYLPQKSSLFCWWCRHQFSTRPLGCPLKYNAKKKYFETEGLFCSFPCTKAYIVDMSPRVRYRESSTLLTFIYLIQFGKIDIIEAAPSWRLLMIYGGHLTIDEFRASFGNYAFDETVNIFRPHLMFTSKFFQEKKLKKNIERK